MLFLADIGGNIMGNRDIKKSNKKQKKADIKTAPIASLKPIVPQPEVIKKAKKDN